MLDTNEMLPALPIHLLDGLSRDLAQYDSTDVLASIGALQLLPENASSCLRLEILAHLAAIQQPTEGKPNVTSANLRALCNDTPLNDGLFLEMEDPFDNPFTETFAFFGGAYIVFPGTADEVTFVLRHLARAIFLDASPFPNKEFVKEARELLHSVLLVSDAIAQRVGLPRGVEPSQDTGQAIVVPGDVELEKSKNAVWFTEAELRQLLAGYDLTVAALEPLVLDLGTVSLESYQRNRGSVTSHPVVRSGTDYIVVLPGVLLSASRDALIRLAQHHQITEELAARFNIAVWVDIEDVLRMLDNLPVAGSLPSWVGFPECREGLFMLDTDKTLYVLLVTDPISSYDGQNPHDHWKEDWLRETERRVAEIERYLLTKNKPPNAVLFLILAQGVYQLTVIGPQEPDEVDAPLILNLTAADLYTLANLERGNPLVLWQYAQADRVLRRETHIFSLGGELDKFQLYRSNGYNFYYDDDARPEGINLLPGRIGELRRELVHRLDIHVAPSFLPNCYLEVESAYDIPEVPVYKPLASFSLNYVLGFRAAFLTEGLPLPLWVVGPAYSSDAQAALQDRYLQLSSAIAYWLWQLSPFLQSPLAALTDQHSLMRVELLLEPHAAWHHPPAAEELLVDLHRAPEGYSALSVSNEADACVIQLTLHPTFVSLLNTPDNRGEREIIRHILTAIRTLLPASVEELLSEHAILNAIEKYAPLGPKKMVLALSTEDAQPMDPRGLPAYQPISKAAEHLLLGELDDYLSKVQHLQVGPIASDQRVQVLDDAVSFFYAQLRRLVASLRPDGLLEFLAAHHEAIVREMTEHRLAMTPRVACFGHDPAMLVRLGLEMDELSIASMSSRFIIEYIASCPPQSVRPISLSVYQRLLAIGAQIINYGFSSDIIHNNLADIELAIGPSGRLGMDKAELARANVIYLPLFAAGELGRASRAFERYWPTQRESELSGPSLEVEEAQRAEFGYTLTELYAFVVEAIQLATENAGAYLAYSSIALDDFMQAMSERLEWQPERVSKILISLTLIPRSDFLNPQAPYESSDVYPWRFNRRLSYLRKPFLYRVNNGTIELVWGPRHLYTAWQYLLELCQGARLQAHSSEMRRLLGKMNEEAGDAFNDAVAAVFSQVSHLLVKKKVGSNARIGYPENQLGDIDVLVADREKRILRLVECKDLAFARTPHEMAKERKALFEGSHRKRSVVEKQELRADWVREHLPQVLTWLGVGTRDNWRVEPIIVVDIEIMTQHLVASTVKVLSIEELRREHLNGLC